MNHMTATVFALPTENSYLSPIERLKSCDIMFEKVRSSVIPYVASGYMSIVGSLFTKAAALIARNRSISVALTNFPTLPPNRKGTKIKDLVFAEFTVGASEGVCGLSFFMASCSSYIRIGVSAEQAVLSQNEADSLVKSMEHEINKLHQLSKFESNRKLG